MIQPTEVGDWKQISILGSGAFGTVMLWRNLKNSDHIAIKKCKFQKPTALSAKQKERWNMEVDFLKSVDHTNIIGFKRLDPKLAEMINKYNPTKLPLLSMEYCKKGNLRRFLTSEPIKLCGLPEQDVRYILGDISSGLNYLHSKKITHRDIKPDNIVLQHCDNRKGETLYKIIDLGYAKELQDATLSFVGTLHYLAPEIFYNQDYGHSVDYWSMGTMVFEIICGVLPFLPELTPYERFEKIKDKGPEDICIYLSNSGAITNSTEIKKEHFVTSCFKQNIESWLKRVLQMDPARRTFNDDISLFEYLRFILDKKIVQVFSVYKQEFYSYEIDDSTLCGTLKDWISRDIKLNKHDLLFLFRSHSITKNKGEREILWDCNDDNALLQCLTSTDDAILYVYNKNTLFCDTDRTSKMPNLVGELFKVDDAKFKLKSLGKVYKKALFYMHTELRTIIEIKAAYLSLIQFIENMCDKIKNSYAIATDLVGQVLSMVDKFLQKKKNGGHSLNNDNIDLSKCPELVDCLKYFVRFISNVERRESKLKDFGKQYEIVERIRLAIGDAQEEIRKILEKCNIETQFNTINGKSFLEKLKNGETHEKTLKSIRDVVSDTLKLKYNLFVKEKVLQDYSKEFCHILKWVEQLLLWINAFINNVQTLSTDFTVMEEKYDGILSEAVKIKKLGFVLSYDIDDTVKIIKENELLRYQFTDLLSEKVAAHEDFANVSMKYLDLNN